MSDNEMKEMKEVPTDGTLVLCWQEMTGFCLRSFQPPEGDFINAYDEHEILDDSELEFIGWWELPSKPRP